jgi:AraC family transcriptional regulator
MDIILDSVDGGGTIHELHASRWPTFIDLPATEEGTLVDPDVWYYESRSLRTPLNGTLPELIRECASENNPVLRHATRDRQGAALAANGAMSLTVQFAPADAVSRQVASWGNATCEIVQANRRERIEGRLRAPVHMLAVYECGLRREGGIYVGGLAQSTLRDCRRKMVFVPAGCDYYEWQEPRTLSRTAYFYLDATLLASECDRSSMSIAPRVFFEDGALWDTALKLITLIESGAPENRRYADALCVVLAHELLRLNAGNRRARARVQPGLAAWQREKVVSYIAEHLAAPIIPLATLAQLVRLSPSYFCRAFRLSFGMPPQRYQIARRIERAKMLLARRTASVTDIGLTVGYSETSSFSSAFRRVTGLTPSAYRMRT